jgi:peptidoglycan/xylan/chitin deacetylase (PgdA/CDA1 family)
MYFRHKTAQQQDQEIMLDDAEIEKVYKMAGQQRPYTKFFRPPGGIYDQTTLQLCIKHGYKIMLWNVITEPNGKNLSVGSRADLIRRAPKGSIILLHSKVSDMDALKIVLPGLIKRYGTQWH